jgi:TonB family protein
MGGPDETPIENPQPNETYTPIETTTEKVEELSQETDEVDVVANKTDDKKDTKPKIIPPIEQPKKIKEQPKEEPKEIVELPRKVNSQSLFRRKTTNSDNGGRGDGDIPGNEGRPDGDPDGIPGGTGTGNSGLGSGTFDGGKGIQISLRGRRIAKKPVISASSKDVGTVVVNITVDRAGNVIKAEPGAKNSTTLNLDKLQKAKQAALSTKFSPKPDGPEEQYGTMTVNFTFE